MKKYLALSLLSSLLLTSCSLDWNDANVKKIGELEKQVQNDTFKKKQECMNTDKLTLFRNQHIFINWSKINGFLYSEKLNTCVVYFSSSSENKDNTIQDILNGKVLFSSVSELEFIEKIKELKWE